MAWTWAAASARGTSHARTGERRQDAYSCFAVKHRLSPFVAIVADGAGSASYGAQGAALVCRSIGSRVRRHFAEASSGMPTDADVENWIDETRDLITAVAGRRSLTSRDFAATLILFIQCGGDVLIAHIGDGCVVLQEAGTGIWVAASWPEHGEYASTTYFLTDENAVRLRITRPPTEARAVALFSDGIERLALDMSAKQPFEPFFDAMVHPLFQVSASGRDRTLSSQLHAYLDGPKVNARTDDDKTLVLAVRTWVPRN